MTSDYIDLEKKFHTLPAQLQEILTSVETADKIETIADTHHLREDQRQFLYDEIVHVILGIRPRGEFIRNFSLEAKVDAKTAKEVTTDIEEQIFSIAQNYLPEKNDISAATNKQVPSSQSSSPISHVAALEQAGDFTIEKENADERNDKFSNSAFANYYNPKKVNLLADENSKEGTEQAMNKAGNIEIQTEDKQEFMEKGDPARFALPNTAYQAHRSPAPNNLPGEKQVIGMTDPHTDALVDNLLDSGRE